MKTMNHPRALGACMMSVLLLSAFASTGRAESKVSDGTAWLGVQLQALNDDLREALEIEEDALGVLIADVFDDSPAEEAGLDDGDVIVSMDGREMTSVKEAVAAIREHSPGDRLTVEALRDGRRRTFDVVLGEAPEYGEPGRMYFPEMGGLEELTKEAYRWAGSLELEGGYLGVGILDLNEDLGEYFKVKAGEGILITEVQEGSPAEEAGLKPGDVVLEFGGKPVKDTSKFREYVASSEPGEEVSMVVKRKGRNKTFAVEIGERELPVSRHMRGFMWPEMHGGKVMVKDKMLVGDDDGDIKVYCVPGGTKKRICIPGEDAFMWYGKKGPRVMIGDIDDLDDLEDLEDIDGLEVLKDVDELNKEIKELQKEMERLRKEVEKLKE